MGGYRPLPRLCVAALLAAVIGGERLALARPNEDVPVLVL